ncbi:MAG: SRPBCC family protein [Acidimicrobiales bacterium]
MEATAVVPLDADRAFALSQTYGELRYRWDPFVVEQRLLNGATAAGKGVQTWTRSRHRLQMISQYIAFRPPEHVGMRMVSGPWFFRTFSGGWNFTPVEADRTLATWRYNFTIRPRWLSPIGDRIGVWILGRDVQRRVQAFAKACGDPDIVAALAAATHPVGPVAEPD